MKGTMVTAKMTIYKGMITLRVTYNLLILFSEFSWRLLNTRPIQEIHDNHNFLITQNTRGDIVTTLTNAAPQPESWLNDRKARREVCNHYILVLSSVQFISKT